MASQYDLTGTLSKYLDRHLVFPLLEFLEGKSIHPPEQLLKGKLDLLSKTNMLDFAMDIYKQLNKCEDVPQEMKDHREKVVSTLKATEASCATIVTLIKENPSISKELDKDFTIQVLQEKYNVDPSEIEALYTFAKFQFDCGNYNGAAEYLYHYRLLSSDVDKSFSALWGKFASEILMQRWDVAMEDMNRLRDIIDNKQSAVQPRKQLLQRTWLIHWSLYVFFNHPAGRTGIADLLMQEKYLNAIQSNCPYVLRYLTAAVITNNTRKRNVVKDLVRIIQQESHTYRDPITEFLESLYISFDFEEAQVKLRECKVVLENDFFLCNYLAEFMENARMFIFETYCRIHQKIDISMLAEKLNMDCEGAERWIVNLIRNAKFDAKIDSASNQVIMGIRTPSVHQQVIEKTKGFYLRTTVLATAIDRKAHGKTPQEE